MIDVNNHFIILGIAVLLLAVSISGCIQISQNEKEKEDSEDTSGNDFWDDSGDDWGDTEVIMVSGIDTQRTINYLDKPVKLMVSGIRNDVTVTKETNLIDVTLSGVDCVVRVSRIHSFTSMISGVGSEIVYYD